MNSEKNLQGFGLGIIGILIIGLILWALFYEIGKAPWQFITILVAAFGALITVTSNLQIQIRNEQKPKKVEIYDRVIKLFFDSLLASKLGQEPKSEKDLIKEFANITPDLILWASDDVLKFYVKFRQIADNAVESKANDSILLFAKMLLSMRKDLGHQNNQINETLILGTFINDVENV